MTEFHREREGSTDVERLDGEGFEELRNERVKFNISFVREDDEKGRPLTMQAMGRPWKRYPGMT